MTAAAPVNPSITLIIHGCQGKGDQPTDHRAHHLLPCTLPPHLLFLLSICCDTSLVRIQATVSIPDSFFFFIIFSHQTFDFLRYPISFSSNFQYSDAVLGLLLGSQSSYLPQRDAEVNPLQPACLPTPTLANRARPPPCRRLKSLTPTLPSPSRSTMKASLGDTS